jgi:ubiquinone biosynthesis protein Coq4
MKTFKLPFQKQSLREVFIEILFKSSLKPYQWLRRNRVSWGFSTNSLLQMPEKTLGNELGMFFEKNKFVPIDKCESHDVFHVLLGYSTDVPSEIRMQYFLLGNRRWSWYTFLTVFLGGFILPEHFPFFFKDFLVGLNCKSVKNWDLKKSLLKPAAQLRGSIFDNMPLEKVDKIYDTPIAELFKNKRNYKIFHTLRERVLTQMVTFLNPIYRIFMPQNRAWKLTKEQLNQFPNGTLGKDLADFLNQNRFDLLPYLETHDVYHTLLSYKPNIVDEARMYFFLLGNRKYSFEVINTVFISLVLLPDYWCDLFKHYQRGRTSKRFVHWDFRYLMHDNTKQLRGIIFNKNEAHFYA